MMVLVKFIDSRTILDLFHAKKKGGRKDLISHVFIVSVLIQC